MKKFTMLSIFLCMSLYKPVSLLSYDINSTNVLIKKMMTFESVKKKAIEGDRISQNEMGVLYIQQPSPLKRDPNKAYYWFKKSAEQGYSDGLYNLGLCFAKGTGTDINEAKAIELYIAAVKKGSGPAATNLGVMHADGRGVPKDLTKAVEWYKIGVSLGDRVSIKNLAIRYYFGGGVRKDYTKSLPLMIALDELGEGDQRLWSGMSEIRRTLSKDQLHMAKLEGGTIAGLVRSYDNRKNHEGYINELDKKILNYLKENQLQEQINVDVEDIHTDDKTKNIIPNNHLGQQYCGIKMSMNKDDIRQIMGPAKQAFESTWLYYLDHNDDGMDRKETVVSIEFIGNRIDSVGCATDFYVPMKNDYCSIRGISIADNKNLVRNKLGKPDKSDICEGLPCDKYGNIVFKYMYDHVWFIKYYNH